MTGYLTVPLPRLLASALFILVAILVSARFGLGLGKSLLVGMARATVQLLGVGYVLLFLFGDVHPLLVVAVLVVMLIVAALASSRRVLHGPGARRLFPRALVAIGAATLVALLPLFTLILPVSPLHDARYVIPLSAMMLSSAMNVVAQVFERIFAQAHGDRATIEQLLALGASPAQALAPHARMAVRGALLPTINVLLTAGVVSLPGMMTGQILSGVDPLQAVRYQLVILFALVAVAAVAGALTAVLSRGILFDAREQLVELPDDVLRD